MEVKNSLGEEIFRSLFKSLSYLISQTFSALVGLYTDQFEFDT